MENNKQNDDITLTLNGNVLTVVLIVLLIGSAFAMGTMWTRLKKSESTREPNSVATNTLPTEDPNQIQTEAVDGIREEDRIRGNRDAKIAIIEYSDLECPFCQKFHPTMEQVMEDFEGEVMWVFRHFPLDFHPKAMPYARAAECAFEQQGDEGFWAVVDAVYAKLPEADTASLGELGNDLGLNRSELETCIDAEDVDGLIEESLSTGLKAGVQGTPSTFVLNTETNESINLSGAVPYNQVKQAIEKLMNN